MSKPLSMVRWNVQMLLGDTNPDRRSIPGPRLDQFIRSNSQRMFNRIVRAREPVESVTLVAGTYEYLLGNRVITVAQVFDNTTGRELVKMDFVNFNRIYRQDTSQPAASGKPEAYTLWQDTTASPGADNRTRIRVGPTPNASGTLKVWKDIEPNFTVPPADTDEVPFDSNDLRVLEFFVAADCCDLLSADELAILKLAPDAGAKFRQVAEQNIHVVNSNMASTGYRQTSVLRASRRGW